MPVATLPITVERADADGVVIRPAGAYPDENVQVTWATLRAAADQGDPDLSREYAAALEVAREMVRGLEGLFTRPLTGAWYEWEDEEGNPCSMIAHADLPYRPNNFGCPPSYAKRIRRADPDEVAAVWREIDQHDEITRLSYGGPK
jgi:hypothetical protein